MKNFGFILLFLASIFVTSCGSSGSSLKKEDAQKEEESQLWKDVLAVHDEVMPKMATLNKLQRELKQISEKKKATVDPAKFENVAKAVQKLEQADDAMMEWMQGFQQLEALQESQTHEQILNYLKDKKTAIKSIQKKMNDAIEDGQKLLDGFVQER